MILLKLLALRNIHLSEDTREDVCKHQLLEIVISITLHNMDVTKVLLKFFPPSIAENKLVLNDTLQACSAFIDAMHSNLEED